MIEMIRVMIKTVNLEFTKKMDESLSMHLSNMLT